MDSDLFQAYFDKTDPNGQQEAANKIDEFMSDPDFIQQIYPYLANHGLPLENRKLMAALMIQLIKTHEEIYTEHAQDIFHDLLALMFDESNLVIIDIVSHALYPIFQCYGEEWSEMVDFINQAFESENIRTNIIGLIFLIEFLPTTKTEYIGEMHQKMIPLLQTIFSQNSKEYILYGFKLFEIIHTKDYLPDPQADTEYAQIYQVMIDIYHNALLEESKDISILSRSIGRSIKKSIPFDSPSNFYQYLIEIASDDSIPVKFRHFPLFAIKKLVKYHGNELKSLVADSIELFLNISELQFQDSNYNGEENSRTIIDLFEKLSSVTNGNDFFECLMNFVSKEADPGASFASLCAIYGASEVLLKQFEENMESLIEYIFDKMTIESKPVIELCLILISIFVNNFTDAMNPYSEKVMNKVYEWVTFDDEDISKDAFQVIAVILTNLEFESSYVIPLLQNLKEMYVQSSMPIIMTAIASAIYACQEEIQPYADELVPIISEGICSDDFQIQINSAEALGHLISYASKEIGDLYADGIEFLSQNAISAECDLELRHVCMIALSSILKSDIKFDDPVIAPAIPFMLLISITGIGIQTNEDDLYSDESEATPGNIILDGFLLLKTLFKYHPNECVRIETEKGEVNNEELLKVLAEQIKVFLRFTEKRIAIKAIHTSVYYLINFQPDETDYFEVYSYILDESKSLDRCQAVLEAFDKLIVHEYKPAIENIITIVDYAIAALNRELHCQLKKFDDDEDRFAFRPEFLEPAYSILCDSFKISIEIKSNEEILELMNNLLSKVDEDEKSQILGTLGDYILAGGVVNEDIVQLALSKLEDFDYNRAPDSIYFLRTLIKCHPEMVSETANELLEFFISQLQNEEVEGQYYWKTMMNIICGVFELANSEALSSLINMEEVIPLVLQKLPVKGELDEADFIYGSLIGYFEANKDQIESNLEGLFRVLILTMSMKNSTFDEFNLQQQTLGNMLGIIEHLFKSYPQLEDEVPNVLDNDEVKIEKLNSRISSE